MRFGSCGLFYFLFYDDASSFVIVGVKQDVGFIITVLRR